MVTITETSELLKKNNRPCIGKVTYVTSVTIKDMLLTNMIFTITSTK